MSSNATQFAFIVHRGMGCDDESATDEEQAEKILYYYPEGADLNEQLNKINMVEGLIDFATKFCVDSINTVVMQQYTWVFSECEKDIWIILAVDSQLTDHPDGLDLTFSHQPNSYAMETSVRNFYSSYYLTHGSIQQRLTGGSDDAVGPIENVKSLRKQIRKHRMRLRQELRDLQSLIDRAKTPDEPSGDSNEGPVEHMGIRANTKTMAEVQQEIDISNDEIFTLSTRLQDALQSADYTPHVVRELLAKFMRWYLQSGDLDMHTSLSAMKGMRVLQSAYADPVLQAVSNCTLTITTAGSNTAATNSSTSNGAGNSVYGNIGQSGALAAGSSLQSGIGANAGGSAFSSTVLRLRETIEEATMKLSIGSVILYDGRLLWSDLDATTTGTFVDYVLMQDRRAVRSLALALMQQQDTKGLVPPAATGPYAKKSSNPDAELEMAVLRSLGQQLTHRGFISQSWVVLNLEDTRVSALLLGGGTGGVAGMNLASRSGDSQGGGSAKLADVTVDHNEGPSQLFCPYIYASGNAGRGGAEQQGGRCIGRAVVYKQARATVVVLLPAWSSDHTSEPATRPASPLPTTAVSTPSGLNYKRRAVGKLLADLRLGHRKLANLKAADYLEYIARYDSTDPAGEMRSEPSASSLGSLSVADAAVDALSAGLVAVESDPVHENRVQNHACLLTLCCKLQMALTPECLRLEKSFKGIQYCDETGAVLRNVGTATSAGVVSADNSGTAGFNSGNTSNNAVSQGNQSASASASSASASATAAYERLASAITIAEELQLGATRPELPLSPTLRNVRFIYYNPVDCSLKVCGINSADLSPLLCSPKQFRDLIAHNLNLPTSRPTSSFVSLNQLNSHSNFGLGPGALTSIANSGAVSGSKLRKITGAVVDKLTDRQAFRFPATSALLSECLEPAVVRALNDIWVELSGKELVGEVCSHPVLEACLRVSTPQRGGVWVTGRRIGDRYLYMIIDRCITMNDMYHAFEHLTELLQK